ncbi:multicopper oxidase family protein [Enterovirga rhinocerotis]|uniref:FtsP/CotA-like multicopper oxidase with cupredoxin domain n=1 Tax=Enterovirga rhinocerotis TaxID=1339210 RepID=A0A4R7C6N7_9HYPH|nr:multicopper oxidase family protein [Enterovirga rhinocerotis]TDR94244.1 FtsP/CotA-like multicopper oxidase with cupredoxin domain [Enterovirga rhinocerotis]
MQPVPDRRLVLAGLAATLVPLKAGAQPAGAAIELAASPRKARLAPGLASEADLWSFGDTAAPPVLRVRHGEELRVRLRNGTPKPLSVHWHGVRGPADQDGVGGVSQPPVRAGETFDYRFTPPDPGTHLVRPLVVGGASEAAGRGLAGLLVVEEKEPPAVDAEFALLLRDWRIEPSGALSPFGRPEESALAGRLGNRLALEGADAPKSVTLPAGARVRLRIANGCNARIMRIRFDGMKAFVAAVDGQPTDTFEPLRSNLPFAPGTRYDVFFDMPGEAGARCSVSALIGQGLPIVEFTAGAGSAAARPDVVALPPNGLLPPEIRLQNALRPELVIGGGATRGADGQPAYPSDPARSWTVNGKPGDAAAPPLFSARRGQPVVLAVTNNTAFVQPVHLHGHVFRLLHPLDDGWEPYWLDTMQVPEGRTLRIAFMADNPGRWTFSSTVLERFDTGLWTTFQVV